MTNKFFCNFTLLSQCLAFFRLHLHFALLLYFELCCSWQLIRNSTVNWRPNPGLTFNCIPSLALSSSPLCRRPCRKRAKTVRRCLCLLRPSAGGMGERESHNQTVSPINR